MISTGVGRHVERTDPVFTLIFVRQGTLHIEEAGHPFAVNVGKSLLLWPGRSHRGTQDYGPDLQFFWLGFSVREVQQGNFATRIPQHTVVTRPDFVTEIFRAFSTTRKPAISILFASQLMLLTELTDSHPPIESNAAAILAGRAYIYIRTHFREKLTATGIARALGCNPQYLSRVVNQVHKQSIPDLLRRTRINHAKSLLLHTSHNIREVSRFSDFQNISYFQRTFKKQEGITPLRYHHLRAHVTINN